MDRLRRSMIFFMRMSKLIRKQIVDVDIEQLESLFRHLEEHRDAPQSKRVEKILDLLSSMRDGLSTSERTQVHMGLANALRRYRWRSFVARAREGFREIRAIADRENLSKEELWEHDAVRNLLDVVPHLGKRPRIRRCIECQGWFFAEKRDDQKYCKRANCKQAHYDKDPDKRKQKNEAMRRLYALKTALARNPKSGIGLELRTERRPKKRKPRTR